MQSLRNRQIREVLDEDMNINRQVFDREKEQVRVFQDTVLPKKTRDVEAEIGVDKLIESINKILENKLSSLEYLLSKITGTSDIGDAEGRRSYNNIISNGDFITVFNQLVRVYTTTGISRNSQEIIKVKFQEIKTNIDAIIYGIEELIQYLFDSGKSDKEIFQLVRSQAVYQIVKDQLYRGSSYKIIEQGDIEVSIKEVLSELSDVQREELRDISGRDITERSLLKLPIEIGNDQDRIKKLEEEMGFRLPAQRIEDLKQFGRRDKEQAFSSFGDIAKKINAENRQEYDEEARELRLQKDEFIIVNKILKRRIRDKKRELRTLQAQQEQLVQGQQYFREDDEEKDDDGDRLPLADEITAKEEEINNLIQLLNDNEESIRSNDEDQIRFKNEYEEYLSKTLGSDSENLPIRKKKVKSLIPTEEKLEPEPEEEPEPEQKEEARVKPSISSSASRSDMIDYYTKPYLQGLSKSQLRVVASKFGYAPHYNTDEQTIIRNILKRQPNIPQDKRRVLGSGVSGGNMFNRVYDDYLNGGAYRGIIVSNPRLFRGQVNYSERPYQMERISRELQNRDYGFDDDDVDNRFFNFSRGGSRFDDRRNDIYYIQRQLKRGY